MDGTVIKVLRSCSLAYLGITSYWIVVGGNHQQYHPLHETVENESRTSRTGQKGAALISLISEYNTRNSWMHICVTCIWEKKGWINSSQTNESSSSVWSGEFFLGKYTSQHVRRLVRAHMHMCCWNHYSKWLKFP